MTSRIPRISPLAVTLGMLAWMLQPPAQAEQWAYAMQTGHGHHSIQVDVDSIAQKAGYVAARLLFEYYPDGAKMSDSAAGPAPRSALEDGAFDCKGRRFQLLSRTEYGLAEAKGPPGAATRSELAEDHWKLASGDPETFAIIDWVCGVAAHRLVDPQAGSIP